VWTDAGCAGDVVAPVTGFRPEVVLPHVVAVAMLSLGSVLLSSKISFRLPGGRRSGVATSRVEGKDFDMVEPEAAKREPTLGG
jgi:hypothetical protein